MTIQSAERVSATDGSDNIVIQRSILAYYRAAELVGGRVLEIGTGSGYGVELIAPHAEGFVTIDKTPTRADLSGYDNVTFMQMKVPPMREIASSSFDWVITFQVIEHIKQDIEFLREIHRVLRPGGRLVITTPNRTMSLTRNPWHVREYTVDQFSNLLSSIFDEVELQGVFGNKKVMDYYYKNRQAVKKITRFDFFDLQHRLPRRLLQIPYDILNRRNRRKLLADNRDLTTGIRMEDYFLAPADDHCFDLLAVAVKKGE